MTVYGYIRVSTDKQTAENQRFEIERFLEHKDFPVDVWINETISGTVDFAKRKIGRTLKRLKKGDVLICSELSRLGRNILDLMTILNICMTKQVQVWTIKESYRLGTDIQSQLLAFVFSMVAQVERTLISQRTKEALNRLKSEGKKLGRKMGSCNKKHVLDGKKDKILKDLSNGFSVIQTARKNGVSKSSVYRFLSQSDGRQVETYQYLPSMTIPF